MFLLQVEERQRLKVAKDASSGVGEDHDPVAAARGKADFLLTFNGVLAKVEVCGFF